MTRTTPRLRSAAIRARSRTARAWVATLLLVAATASPRPLRAEVVEEVVARINDDMITRSELKEAEQQVAEDILNKGTSDSANQISKAKSELLRDMITKKLLVQQAERLYDLNKMQDAFVRQFKEQQKIATNTELEKMLAQENLTLDDFKRRLVEINAPGSVIDMEVRSKISVSDAEVEAFYKSHTRELSSQERVSFREIVLIPDDRGSDQRLASAKALADKAKSGSNFAQLAAESSQVDPGVRGNVLGPFLHGELAPELERVVFTMKPGEVSDPINVGEALHVVRIEGREDSVTPPLETIKDKLVDAIERGKFDAKLEEYLKSLWENSKIKVADEYMQRLPVDFRKYVKD